MDKRTIWALGLTLALLIVFQMYFLPKEAQKQPAVQTQPQAETAAKPAAVETKDQKKESDTVKKETSPIKTETKATKYFVAETPYLKVTFSDLGGGISSVELKKYKASVKGDKNKEIIEDIKPYTYIPKIFQQLTKNGSTDDSTYFKPDKETLTVKDKPETLTLTGTLGNGSKVNKIYTFNPDNYTIDLKIETDTSNIKDIFLDVSVINEKKDSAYVFKGPFVYNEKSLRQINKIEGTSVKLSRMFILPDETVPASFDKKYTYAGFDEGFFTFIWMPESDSKPTLTIMKTENNIPVIRLFSDKGSISGKLYFGPKETKTLESLNVGAEKIIDFGSFDVIAKPLIWALKFSNTFTHNYGIDIILLTILIKLIFHPLSVKSYRSMKKMQELQPLIKKLKEKYPNDKQKLNAEMMDMYKTRGINPMGGCLPMIIQIPVFFALYKGLSGAIELRHAPFMFWINDLSAPEDLFSFTVAGYTLPFRILPLIMGVTQVIQQKMTPTSVDPMQEKMMLCMPIFFTFLFWGFPSGLVLYWLINNVISIGQQYYINKQAK
jgi:YidC/Oxa1 family membrane protein insertase